MPILRSAKKALRQSMRRHARNLARVHAFRNILKETYRLFHAGKTNEARALLPNAYQALDKAAKCRVVKKNTVARAKSRLAKLLK